MDLGLTGRRALVLASTRGLGRAIATALAAEGATVSICGRSDAERAAAELARETGATVQGFTLDLHERSQIDWLLEAATKTMGGIDILVLNGGGPPPAPALDVTSQAWSTWFERMVANLIYAAARAVPAMRERRWGRLLTVASSAAVQPIGGMALSNSLRASLLAWNKTLAAEVAGDGVTCNVILPGRIDTERVATLDAAKAEREARTPEAVRRESQAGIPAGRYGRPEEFGAVAAFLCSERASYVTGTLQRVDGGMIRGI
jgi:3-oxoacyl-[acyl-carrier protein] reductase